LNEHLIYMRRALDLASKGLGHVQPNPVVGCVIVHNDEIIGEGFHHRYGGSHAEVVAVQSVIRTDLIRESTMYVTLEPCAHYGKTPPCTELIIEKEIKKIVIGCKDPFEAVNGKGMEKLQNAGCDVISGILEKECHWINRRFFTFHEKKRPYIILKWAQSQDGFIDPPRAKNQKGSIAVSSDFSRTISHKWRTEEQAILIGKNTALVDNPALTPRLYLGNQPLRILIDPKLEVPDTYQLFSDDHRTLVINEKKTGAEGTVLYHRISFKNFFTELFHALYEMQIQSVIIEGGQFTLQQFIDSGNWDEARVFTSDQVFVAGVHAPVFNFDFSDEIDSGNDKLRVYYNTTE
jgi:diaminohydroxyphosphoribosylaminopyrimidine deaminase / 5-amino-6-(5-phosphoribosylamino)uracil reductase